MINKSLYKLYLTCPEEAWLSYHEPSRTLAPDDEALFRMRQGQEVDVFAQELFKDKKTLRELGIVGKEIRFQFRSEADGFVAIADIVAIDSATNTIDVFEVKASFDYKKVVGEYTDDVAFQCQVFERQGFTIGKVFIISLDPTFVYDGTPIKASAFFRHPNITAELHKQLAQVKAKAQELKDYLTLPEPEAHLKLCGNKRDCLFFQKHYADLLPPNRSVFDLNDIRSAKLKPLVEGNILDILDIPSDYKLADRQRQQVNITQQNQIIFEKKKIEDELKNLRYPLYFLDYETINLVFPKHAGYEPYDQVVFQYSLHILESPDATLQHKEYISKALHEPIPTLLAQLQDDLKNDNGSVIVWNKPFEATRNKEMAAIYPAFAPFLDNVNERIFDLMLIFQKGLYQHPAFRGSYSIKNILPVLVPQFSYKNLVIQNGTQANTTWYRNVTVATNDLQKAETFKHLLAYCHLDTLAMVEIFRVLR
jgi:hypothetical protein